ncbi:alpha/beta hydrolase family protein [Oceanobacillus sp. J11TS1]|uniref:alpha/beta hydrolase n=1 Tax=Oceanobacillus sp. J11TS1 TaxID=2807191 RepID=UPI001B1091FC|nr:alpha/beta hydrolase family protein [Oceanobacillus sp. J11TS1]GIO23758.1 esterase [Oceanobacillus sp. J11TS1]
MALFRNTIYSDSLMLNTDVTVILPIPNVSNMEDGDTLRLPEDGEKYQTLWLLHCGTGDNNELLRFSRIEEYAQQKQLAVVMPNVGNSYYCNVPNGGNYYDYYTKELPQIMRAIFPLSEIRVNNFIGGISMGGFGAFAAALRNPDNYAAAFSLSGGLDFRNVNFGENLKRYYENTCKTLFGENDQHYDPQSHDLVAMAKNLVDSGKEQPLLYALNGKDDPIIYDSTAKSVAGIRDSGLDVTYVEERGGHEWDLWDPYLRKILDWLPLAGSFVK